MPSTDPLRRDVQLDLFPSNIVDSIQVQKSFSASELASTTGGSISVITKGMPEEREVEIYRFRLELMLNLRAILCKVIEIASVRSGDMMLA